MIKRDEVKPSEGNEILQGCPRVADWLKLAESASLLIAVLIVMQSREPLYCLTMAHHDGKHRPLKI